MKIAYFGGTFDPIHHAHEEIIAAVSKEYDVLIVIPCHNWTKSSATFPLSQRYDSVKSVCDKYPNVVVPEWCLTEDTSSTLKIAERLTNEYGSAPEIVIGSDNTQKITTWKNWDKLQEYGFAIVRRANEPLDLSPFKKSRIFNFNASDISSTEIRREQKMDFIPKVAIKHLDLKLIGKTE